MNPWDQLEDEPAAHFARFKRFLAIPKESRTLVKCYKQETGRNTQPSELWNFAYRKYKWKARAAAYDLSRAEKLLIKAEEIDEIIRKNTLESIKVISETILNALLSGKEMDEEVKFRLSLLEKFGGEGSTIGRVFETYRTLFAKEQKAGDINLSKHELKFVFGDMHDQLPKSNPIPQLPTIDIQSETNY